MRRYIPVFCLLVVILTNLACEGGTSGSVIGSGETCRASGNDGVCEGTFKKLSGTYTKDIENDSIFSGDEIDVEVYVSVESGAVRVSLTSPEGETVHADAQPGQNMRLVGVAEGTFDGFEVTFEALDDQANNVTYKITYQIQ